MTYLAAERVVDRGGRSKAAKALIEEFRERVRCAKLELERLRHCRAPLIDSMRSHLEALCSSWQIKSQIL